MGRIDQLINNLSQSAHRPLALRVAGNLVYGWFLINALIFSGQTELVWGIDTVLARFGTTDRALDNFAYAMMYDLSLYPWVYVVHLLSALLSMTDTRWTFLARICTWLTGLLLFFSAIPAFNSGMLLMLLLAFYLIPVYTKALNPYRIVLNNAAFYASMLQVMLVYAFSVFFKLTGQQWIDGSALYYSLSIDRFSNSYFHSPAFLKHTWLLTFLTYLTLAYQLAFPILANIKWGRIFFLCVGVAFHLFIGAVMHLWDFALAMIFSYAFFIEEKRWQWLFDKLSFSAQKEKSL